MAFLDNDFKLDDLSLQKAIAVSKVKQLMLFDTSEAKMVRQASNGSASTDNLIQLFTQMLACLSMKTDGDVDQIMKSVAANVSKTEGSIFGQAAKVNSSETRKDEIKVVSKAQRDSHYQIDISKDTISLHGKKVYMVSCYARDAYLGRYVVKRNYFFTSDRESYANEAYDEIMTKMAALKDRYYNDLIKVSAISTQLKGILDGVVSEIKMEEDSISTNINRSPLDNSR